MLVVALAQSARAQETVPVVVTSATGEHLFRAEVAATTEQRARGLMFREHLDPDAGMLFLFDPPRHVGFWMKNTLIPLDMLFADEAGRIVAIVERAEPHSLEPRGPDAAVAAVLEINGGLAERLGIAVGDALRGGPLQR
jgi:uncharacterized membrane protein (UPF0127 family)